MCGKSQSHDYPVSTFSSNYDLSWHESKQCLLYGCNLCTREQRGWTRVLRECVFRKEFCVLSAQQSPDTCYCLCEHYQISLTSTTMAKRSLEEFWKRISILWNWSAVGFGYLQHLAQEDSSVKTAPEAHESHCDSVWCHFLSEATNVETPFKE